MASLGNYSIDVGNFVKSQLTVNVHFKRVKQFSVRASMAGYILGAACFFATKILGCKGDFLVEMVYDGDSSKVILKHLEHLEEK